MYMIHNLTLWDSKAPCKRCYCTLLHVHLTSRAPDKVAATSYKLASSLRRKVVPISNYNEHACSRARIARRGKPRAATPRVYVSGALTLRARVSRARSAAIERGNARRERVHTSRARRSTLPLDWPLIGRRLTAICSPRFRNVLVLAALTGP